VISLHSSASNAEETFTLTGGVTQSASGLQIRITLDTDDLNDIKERVNLFVNQSTSFVSLTAATIEDIAGNAVTAIDAESALGAHTFTVDGTGPSLEGFDLNMNIGRLTLRFFETVDVSTLNTREITLQTSSDASSTFQYRLREATLLDQSEDSTVVVIELPRADMDVLKIRGIGRSASHSWLTVTESVISDMVGNSAQPVINGVNALDVDVFTEDVTKPEVDSFELSLNDGTLLLHFSEAVDDSTLDVNGITLQNAGASSTSSYSLTSVGNTRSCRVCGAEEYQTAPCSHSADTQCEACDSCEVGFFEVSQCTEDSNTLCGECSSCANDEFVLAQCSERADTVCKSCSSCGGNEFVSESCTDTVDTVCSACSECGIGEFQTDTCGANTDTVCSDCQLCDDGFFESTVCGFDSDTECTACSSCAANEFIHAPCVERADTVCKTCSSCLESEFEAESCDGAGDIDTVCSACTICGANEFAASPCGITSDTECQECQECGPGLYAASFCTATDDTDCVACDDAHCLVCTGPGATCRMCESGFFLNNGECVA